MTLRPGSIYLHHHSGELCSVVNKIKVQHSNEDYVIYNKISENVRSFMISESMFLGSVELGKIFNINRFIEVKNVPEWLTINVDNQLDKFNINQISGKIRKEELLYILEKQYNKKPKDIKGSAIHFKSEQTYLIFDDIAINIGKI
jgi:hypothetical protein